MNKGLNIYKNYINLTRENVIPQVHLVVVCTEIEVNVLIALPTDAAHIRVFEKTLIGGFSFVNTRLAFDTQSLLSEKQN